MSYVFVSVDRALFNTISSRYFPACSGVSAITVERCGKQSGGITVREAYGVMEQHEAYW